MKILNLLTTLLIFCTLLTSCNFFNDDFQSPDLKSESIKIKNNEVLSIEVVRNYFTNSSTLTNSIVDSIKIRNIFHSDLTNLDIIINFYANSIFSNENLLLSYRLKTDINDTIPLKPNEQKVFFLDDNARIKMDNSLADLFVISTGNNFDFNGSGTYGSYYDYYKIDTINKNIENYDTIYYENGTASCIVDYKGNLLIKPNNSSIYNLVTGNINLDKHFLGRVQNNLDTIGKLESKPINFPYSLNDSTINIFSLEKKLPNDQEINEFQFIFYKN